MKKFTFPLKATALIVLTTLSQQVSAVHPVYNEEDLYVQDRDVLYALVKDYLTVTTLAEITEPDNNYSGLFLGVHNRTGNPVRINWYGDMDGKNPQIGAINNGRIYGRMFVNALDSFDTYEAVLNNSKVTLKDYRSSIAPDGQANGIDAYGWVPVSNENDMTFALDKVENTGVVSGFAQLQTGAGTHRSLVVVNASANGASLYGFGDYGKYIIGADGSEVAVDAATGGSRSARSVRSANEAAATGVDGVGVIPASLSSDDKNFYGKNIRVALEAKDKQAVALKNTGTIQGQVVVRGNTGSKAVSDEYGQDYSLTSKASGNGVSLFTQIMTQDRRTYSYDKVTESILGNVENLGTISGNASLSGIAPVSNGGSTNYTRSYDSGNGISVAARTTRFSKNVTEAAIGNVVNDGRITGKLVQVSGDNTAKRGTSPTNINHVYSQAEAENGGNGVGVFVQVDQHVAGSADEDGIHSDGATLTLGDITNRGRITGYADLAAGNGYDFIRMGGIDATGIIGVGNGVSATMKAGSVPSATYNIGKVNNSGVISGYLRAKAGQGVAKNGQPALEEVKLLITDEKTFGSYNQPEVLPKSVGGSSGPCWTAAECANANGDTADAISTIKASGNGLSFFANRISSSQNGDTYSMGDIFNKGVISGYSEMYHGFQGTNYARVDFLATGIGIAADREFTAAVNNLGIISGNHAALLAKSEISTAYSSWEPDYLSGYKKAINNYGVMAGTLIAANYQANGSNSNGKYQQYQYFNASQDPVNNLGTLVYLKEGITKASKYSSAVRNADAGVISRIVAGTGGEVSIDDGQGNQVTYTVVNGKVTGKDSSYTVAADALDHHIINGVGAASGAAVVTKDLSLTNSVVNGLVTAVDLQGASALTLDNTVINTNGFAVRKSATEFYTPNAILGDDAANTVILRNGSTINGDVHLNGGNDKFVVGDESVRINVTEHTLDLGEGEDELVLGEKVTAPTASPIVVDYTVSGVERLLVNQPSRIMANKMELPSYMELHNKLVYQAPNSMATSLHPDNAEQPVVSLAGKTLKVGIRSQEAYGALEVENANLNVDGANLVVDSSLLDKATVEKENWVIKDVIGVKRTIYQCGDMATAGQNCDGYDRDPRIADSYSLKGNFASIEDTSAIFAFEEYHQGRDKEGNQVDIDDIQAATLAINLRIKQVKKVEDIVTGKDIDESETAPTNEQANNDSISKQETPDTKVSNKNDIAPVSTQNEPRKQVNAIVDPIINNSATRAVARAMDVVINNAVNGDTAAVELAKALGGLQNNQQIITAVSDAVPAINSNVSGLITGASRFMMSNVLSGATGIINPPVTTASLNTWVPQDNYRDHYVWGKFISNWNKHNADNGIAGYKTDNRGFILGGSKRVTKDFNIGAVLGYIRTSSHTIDSTQQQSLTAETWQGGLYSDWFFMPNVALETQLGYGHSSVSAKRDQTVFNQVAKAKYGANLGYASIGVRYYQGNDDYLITPFFRANYNVVKTDAYQETGAVTSLKVKADTDQSLTLQSGIDAEMIVGERWKVGSTLAAEVETLKVNQSIKASFTATPSETFVVQGLDKQRVQGIFGVRTEYTITPFSAVTLRYNANVGKKYLGQQVDLNFRFAF
ncbi:hypothetical protein QV09_07690 [Gallibacterium salpingitidis]|uniref:Autotransporter domain-containing protein n=1 Tax=Gallibacterium salpingitidis TaxID=505341 RepID=A0AB36E4W9_9PAST|nr:autotransporter outer membrane beta-barrel domain-containing protein [Gallibacterium salpingitidis]OBX09679.1 hypothetical protein QV09_07690 [Gallibacterium salpingitidis]